MTLTVKFSTFFVSLQNLKKPSEVWSLIFFLSLHVFFLNNEMFKMTCLQKKKKKV